MPEANQQLIHLRLRQQAGGRRGQGQAVLLPPLVAESPDVQDRIDIGFTGIRLRRFQAEQEFHRAAETLTDSQQGRHAGDLPGRRKAVQGIPGWKRTDTILTTRWGKQKVYRKEEPYYPF